MVRYIIPHVGLLLKLFLRNILIPRGSRNVNPARMRKFAHMEGSSGVICIHILNKTYTHCVTYTHRVTYTHCVIVLSTEELCTLRCPKIAMRG